MSAKPRITHASAAAQQYLSLWLENAGGSRLLAGSVVARERDRNGAVRELRFYNDAALEPGDRVKIVASITQATEVDFRAYRVAGQTVDDYALTGRAVRGILGWRLSA